MVIASCLSRNCLEYCLGLSRENHGNVEECLDLALRKGKAVGETKPTEKEQQDGNESRRYTDDTEIETYVPLDVWLFDNSRIVHVPSTSTRTVY